MSPEIETLINDSSDMVRVGLIAGISADTIAATKITAFVEMGFDAKTATGLTGIIMDRAQSGFIFNESHTRGLYAMVAEAVK